MSQPLLTSQDVTKLLFKKVKLNKTKPAEIADLLTTSVDINVKNAWGETLIYNCCKHAVNIPLLDYLYDNGCDPNVINTKKLNAFNACLEWNHKKNNYAVLDWLHSKNCAIQKHYPNLPYLHNMIICHGNDNSLPWIAKHFSLNEQDTVNGNTALCISVHQDTEHNSPVPCKWLCDRASKNGDVDVNIQNKLGETALHIACKSGFSNCIRQLIAAKADLTLKDASGKTAYEVLLGAKESKEPRKWPGDFKDSLIVMEAAIKGEPISAKRPGRVIVLNV
jgi:ankyrin repeat protein